MLRGIAVAAILVAAGGAGARPAAAAPPGGSAVEADRLWTVGSAAFRDTLYREAYRILGQLLETAPDDPRRGDAMLLRGRAAFELGQFAEALPELQAAEAATTLSSSPGEAVFWQGESFLNLRQCGDAARAYARFLDLAPTSPHRGGALFGLATCEFQAQRPGAAIDALLMLVAQHPDSRFAEQATYTAALELVRARRWDEARPLLETFGSRYRFSRMRADAQYLLGVTLLQGGRTDDRAVQTLDRFVAEAPTHDLVPEARSLLAEAHVKARRTREALDQYVALTRQTAKPELVPPALYHAGELYAQLGRASEAETAWKRLRREFPSHALAPPAGIHLAGLYAGRSQFDRAAATAREVAEAGGAERLRGLLLAGEYASKGGQRADAQKTYPTARADAQKAFVAALGEAPAGSAEWEQALDGLLLLTDAAARQASQQETAERLLETVLAQAPAGSALRERALGTLVLLGDTVFKARKLTDAERLFTAALADVATESPARTGALSGLLRLGEAALRAKRLADADRLYGLVVVSAPPQSPERTHALTGLLLAGQQALDAARREDAQRLYARVLTEAPAGSPQRFQALAGLGSLAEGRGDTEDATRAYTEVAEEAKDAALVRWARARLRTLRPADKARSGKRP